MFNKLDMSKKFELVVKQEIKNYQDSLNFVLQSINEIKESINLLKENNNKTFLFLINKNKTLENGIKDLKEIHNENVVKIENCNSRYDAFDKKCNERIEFIDKTSQANIQNYLSSQKEISELQKSIKCLREEVKNSSVDISHMLNEVMYKINKQLDSTKNEVKAYPCKSETQVKNLEDRFGEYKLDVGGLLSELNLFKRENQITQKKIENIYTLIERLQKLTEGNK